ncbi:MAG TPA: alpha/beta fold hydrolase [Croceibacterium sp.]|nr:alpha/beta fold hydrolase [Croceibacterium sp.]
MKLTKWAAGVLALMTLTVASAQAQNITAPPAAVPNGITVEEVKVHSAAVAGNLEGNSAERSAMVVLPPSYASNPNKRYPVIYYLHGFSIDGRNFYNFMKVPEAVAANAAQGREFIVVVPDTLTKMGGSMYSNSVTTGDFQTFIAKDLVAYIDGKYRTIASRDGRGLVGHSMGGYGTWRIAMRYPEVYAAIWAQSACCVSPRTETVESATAMANVPYADVDKAGFGMRAGLASAVAWAPNPNNPPYYVDFPLKDGKVDQFVIAQWAANSPLALVASHVDALKSFKAIGSDVGDKDGLIRDDTMMHEELQKFGVAHEWAVYEGTHTDKIGQRFSEIVLPFMAGHLAK